MKIASVQPKYVKQTAEKTKKKALRRALRRTQESAGPRTSGQAATPSLELYQKEECRFSHAVRNHLSRLGLDFVSHTVPDGNSLKHEQLVHAGGKDEIPFLIDHKTGVRLFQSQAIINYLDKEYGQVREGAIRGWAHELDLRVRARADQLAWAIRTPFDRARDVVEDLSEGLSTLRKSYKVVKKVIQAPLRDKEVRRAA